MREARHRPQRAILLVRGIGASYAAHPDMNIHVTRYTLHFLAKSLVNTRLQTVQC